MAKFGCPEVSDEEITVAAEALSRASNYAVQGQGARNLAYAALVAVRGAHFRERNDMNDHLGRSEKDFAIEFGEYLARAAAQVLPQLTDPESSRALRSAIYEFRKRAIKAAIPVHDHLFKS